ncbi:hypothetical protein QYF61_010900, partial [Mycteria americana]
MIFKHDVSECTLGKFADDTKQGGVAGRPAGGTATQRERDRLGKWANRNLMQLKEGKCHVLHLGRNDPRHRYRRGSSSPQKGLGDKLTMSHQRALAAKQANSLRGCIRQSIASRSREGIPSLSAALALEHLTYKERLRELGVFSLEKGSSGASDRTRGKRHRLKHRRFCLAIRRNCFYCEDGQALTQAAMRGCGVSMLGAVENLTAHSPEQPVLVDPVLSGVGLDNLQRPLPHFSQQFCALSLNVLG